MYNKIIKNSQTVQNTHCFKTIMLLVRRQIGHMSCENLQYLQSSFWYWMPNFGLTAVTINTIKIRSTKRAKHPNSNKFTLTDGQQTQQIIYFLLKISITDKECNSSKGHRFSVNANEQRIKLAYMLGHTCHNCLHHMIHR